MRTFRADERIKHSAVKQIASMFLCALLLLSPAAAMNDADIPAETGPYRCTAVYVGKAVSAEGTTLIGRSEDQAIGAYNKLFFVRPATNASGGVIVDTGEGQNGFSVEIPEKTLKYTYLQDASDLDDGPYYACCMNECGVAVIGTVSTMVSGEYAALDPLKQEGDGLRESILPAVLACQAVSAEDAVRVLAEYVDRYGSAEYNTLLISDRNEAWIVEIYGGATYAALRLPEDQMAVLANQIMIGWVDLDATDGVLFSPKLRGCLEQLADPVRDAEGRWNLAQSIEPGSRLRASNMRVWRGQQLFAPSSAGTYSDDEFYPLLFKPEKKVSVTDVMQLFGDRYEGTEFDVSIPGNSPKRVIGFTFQSDVHIVQTFPELPAETCQLQWLAMGNAEHAIFVPAFSGISDTYEKYKVDNTEPMTVNDSFYYICKSICSAAETDRAYLSQGVKDFNLAQEKQMLAEILNMLPSIQAAWAVSPEYGEGYVTEKAMQTAEKQYRNAQELFRRLLYVQMYNQVDPGLEWIKIKFSAPEDMLSEAVPVSRGEFVRMLWALEGEPAVDHAMDYSDVSSGDALAEAVRWATACGITQGCGGGRFGSDDGLSREQLFTLLFRYAAYKGAASAPDTGYLDYYDAEGVSPWAVDAFLWAVQAQLIDSEARCLLPKFAADRTLAETALEWVQS